MSKNMQIAEQLTRTVSTRDAVAAAQLYSEDAIYMLPGEQEPLRGRKAIEGSYATFFRAFPDFNIELTFGMVSGEHYAGEGVFRGTHTGPLASPQGDVAPTGRKIEVKCAFFLSITPDGLVAEDRSYFDSGVMMSQLGLTEQPDKLS